MGFAVSPTSSIRESVDPGDTHAVEHGCEVLQLLIDLDYATPVGDHTIKLHPVIMAKLVAHGWGSEVL